MCSSLMFLLTHLSTLTSSPCWFCRYTTSPDALFCSWDNYCTTAAWRTLSLNTCTLRGGALVDIKTQFWERCKVTKIKKLVTSFHENTMNKVFLWYMRFCSSSTLLSFVSEILKKAHTETETHRGEFQSWASLSLLKKWLRSHCCISPPSFP